MMTHDTHENRQAGVPVGNGVEETGEVAHGDRRDEVHYEPDPGAVAKVSFLEKPKGPLPPDIQPKADTPNEGRSEAPHVEAVAVSTSTASAWDARPPEDEPER